MQKLTHQELLARQEEKSEKKLPFCVVLNNIRSLYNVGSIFRTADGAGVEKIYLCGITGIPPSTQISKTALGAEEVVSWEYSKCAVDCLKSLRTQGYEIVLLEQTQQSIAYETYGVKGPVCLVLGNEVGGVEDSLLSHCDRAVEISMEGKKNSLNVSVAFGIVGYHIKNQLRKSFDGI